jgi:hypothetical protein
MSRAQLTSTVEQNTGGAVAPFVAGKNAIINGNFDIFQRSSFSSQTSSGYTLDRWWAGLGGTVTVSQQTTGAPNGSRYLMRVAYNASSSFSNTYQFIETNNVAVLWGNSVTFSVLLRRNSSFAANLTIGVQKTSTVDGGAGASWTDIGNTTISNSNLPTGTGSSNWYKASVTVTVPNDGTANGLKVYINESSSGSSGAYYEIAQAQLEVGSVATPFSRAGSTLQGELALCQRYFQRIGNNGGAYFIYCIATAEGSGTIWGAIPLPVTMRTTPSMTATSSGSTFTVLGYGNIAGSSIYLDTAQSGVSSITMGANTLSGFTQRQSVYIRNTNDSTGTYISLSAEL